MKILFKNGCFVNVFTGELECADILIQDDIIIGLGDYCDEDADVVRDISGKVVCPGFIDAHIHIESTMLTPSELAKVCVPHGTTCMIADPHEIANVCGRNGIAFMLQTSKNLPMSVYFMMPSCVPATSFDEAGATLHAEDIKPFYAEQRVLGLGEMMNYPGVIAGDQEVMAKIHDAKQAGKIVNGHAPMLSGHELDAYIAAGIWDDHECSSVEEAKERIQKGQRVMIRQGTAARNLKALLPLFEEPWASHCMLATDDKHPADLITNGHIDSIIREAVSYGKSPIVGIQMATIQAAEYYGLSRIGAVAPGYQADLLLLNDLDTVDVGEVYKAGKLVARDGESEAFVRPRADSDIWKAVRSSFLMDPVSEESFQIPEMKRKCRVIQVVPSELITLETEAEIDTKEKNGIDLERDILKIAVIERHMHTGHIGIGFIKGIGLKSGAIASSVSHDSHNLIVIGTNEKDMATVANHVRETGGGLAASRNGEILADMPLTLGGLMNSGTAQEVAAMNERLREKAEELGYWPGIEPFMNMAFVSLPVIPHLKLTTKGLVDVDRQTLVPLRFDE